MPFETMNPIMLNKNHILANFIVQDSHHRIKHNGERHILSEARNEYWIPRGKSLIKHIFYYCIT